jgi:hypothetical protein
LIVWDEMTHEFLTGVQSIVEPVLAELGFRVDEYVGDLDEGGPKAAVAFYLSSDCKMQIYKSEREGEVNCMIAPVNVPNEFGLRADKWQFLTRFSKRPDLPLAELAELARAEYNAYANPLEWVRDRIATNYEAAHAGILEMYPTG